MECEAQHGKRGSAGGGASGEAAVSARIGTGVGDWTGAVTARTNERRGSDAELCASRLPILSFWWGSREEEVGAILSVVGDWKGYMGLQSYEESA